MGPYTGNAIASIAGNERVGVVDANVIRVLARLRKLTGDGKGSAGTKLLAGLADALVDPDRPGCFNQVQCKLFEYSLLSHVQCGAVNCVVEVLLSKCTVQQLL